VITLKTANDVIRSGYNAISQNGEVFMIVAGSRFELVLRHEDSKEIMTMNVSDVEKFVTVI
jgi:hypothetical protein